MELNYLRSFYEVAKAGSFTGAARTLRISQSALSKSVALLEEGEGVRLFERTKKGVLLTSAGREVFHKCERLFQIVIEIEATCRGIKEMIGGPLSIGASDHVFNYLLVKKFKEIRNLYPKVVPRLFSGTPHDIVNLIHQNEVEFGLFFTRINAPEIKYDPLFSLDMAVVCHPQWTSQIKGPLAPRNLKTILERAGFLGSIRSQYQKPPSREFLELLRSKPHMVAESNSQETQKRLCLEGLGVAFLARFMVENEINSGDLIEIPVKQPISSQLYLARRKGRDLSLNAKTFLKLFGSAYSS